MQHRIRGRRGARRRLSALAIAGALVLASSMGPAADTAHSQASCNPTATRDVRGEGCPLDFSVPVRASLTRTASLHYWHITVPVTGRVTFELSPRQPVDLDLYVETPRGDVISAQRDEPARELSTFVCEAPGEYRVFVQINESRDPLLSQVEYRLAAHASPEIAAALPPPTLSGDGRPVGLHLRQIVMMGFGPAGDVLASTSDDGILRLWQVATGGLVAVVGEDAGPIRNLAFSADGRLLATGGRGGSVRIWSLGGSVLAPVGGRVEVADPRSPAPRPVFAPDGGALAIAKVKEGGTNDHQLVEIWRATDYMASARIGADDGVMGLAFTPDSHSLILTTRHIAGAGWTLQAYDPATGTPTASLRGIDAIATNTVSVAPPVVDGSGQLVAVATRFETPALEDAIRIWRIGAAAFEREIRIPTRKEADLASVAFTPDGQSVVVLYGRAGRLIGAFGMNRPRQIVQSRALVARRCGWDEALALAEGWT